MDRETYRIPGFLFNGIHVGIKDGAEGIVADLFTGAGNCLWRLHDKRL